MRREDLTIGDVMKFFDLWDGNGDGEQLFEDGAIAVGISEYGQVFECVVDFEVVEENEENVLYSLIKITDVDFSEIEEFEEAEEED